MNVLMTLMFSLFVFCMAHAQTDNQELLKMYEMDQKSRTSGPIDWMQLKKEDSIRRKRVWELLDSSKVISGNDYYHAAMIFQHGNDTIASGMAVKMMKQAISKDSTMNKWLLAAAIDRDLMRKGKPQIYGTQYIISPTTNNKYELYKIDTTKISDATRREYNVRTLAEQREQVTRMNKKHLSTILGKSADQEIYNIIKTGFEKGESDYDLSEMAINSLGYYFMNQMNNLPMALRIFKLNVEQYPSSGNTWDSYGEALLKDGQIQKALKAYKKSLQINPDNKNARIILNQNRKE